MDQVAMIGYYNSEFVFYSFLIPHLSPVISYL